MLSRHRWNKMRDFGMVWNASSCWWETGGRWGWGVEAGRQFGAVSRAALRRTVGLTHYRSISHLKPQSLRVLIYKSGQGSFGYKMFRLLLSCSLSHSTRQVDLQPLCTVRLSHRCSPRAQHRAWAHSRCSQNTGSVSEWGIEWVVGGSLIMSTTFSPFFSPPPIWRPTILICPGLSQVLVPEAPLPEKTFNLRQTRIISHTTFSPLSLSMLQVGPRHSKPYLKPLEIFRTTDIQFKGTEKVGICFVYLPLE